MKFASACEFQLKNLVVRIAIILKVNRLAFTKPEHRPEHDTEQYEADRIGRLLTESVGKIVEDDDVHHELCNDENPVDRRRPTEHPRADQHNEIRHEKCLVLLTAADSLAELVVGEDGDEGVPTRHAELGIHLPLADKCHDRDGEQQEQCKERRTEQGRLTLPIVETRGFSVLRGLPSGTVTVPSGLTSSPRAFRRL